MDYRFCDLRLYLLRRNQLLQLYDELYYGYYGSSAVLAMSGNYRIPYGSF